MFLFKPVAVLALAFSAGASPVKGISGELYNRIRHFGAISYATYAGDSCTLSGLSRISTIQDSTTATYAWLLRDDAARELIVCFRGSHDSVNFQQDGNWTLANLNTLPSCSGCQIQAGYHQNWVAVYSQFESLLKTNIAKYPGYGVVITGHSLGASLAAIAAAHVPSLTSNFSAYSYGEPRSGNAAFAGFVDNAFTTGSLNTTKFYRVTHENDGIVVVPPTSDGFEHHGLELWTRDPTSAGNTYICGGETTECAEGAGGSGINNAHNSYFGLSPGRCSS